MGLNQAKEANRSPTVRSVDVPVNRGTVPMTGAR